ncbi:hypothetical protein ASPNIDRAFT_36965 [Aspergillus niger ATCC 1015]|uniref:Uncharacterized protein n=1 Tax=Aspergillus niger (strain ATCC 1015 / CBS 113.46 / FGSC A1144 / LSHB Ac4 / NCTC 3858a / NRRL 328 / USDA 3528.7) TaxID=380704 RepID=G3Y389_ASPNA|nr:uncharacterized protein BO96DRAFT_418423 [Aspergillus niger CBS 101883]EHA22934.1 hypothetical protein ASPNIDRAFT_36965 [Aspergillus niger ATCC 1015]PYH62986.1 hypothetical protein BO96DRAFT_418423 [Aspergillus niger CBS 101883]
MFERVSTALAKIIQNNPWMSQVAGILPLPALIDFVDIPVKIHTLQVTGSYPLGHVPCWEDCGREGRGRNTTILANDTSRLCPGAMKAINPILEPSDERSLWEEATREAMMLCEDVPVEKRITGLSSTECGNLLGEEWKRQYGRLYWMPFISEGIYMAAKIRSEAGLSGRMVGGSGV